MSIFEGDSLCTDISALLQELGAVTFCSCSPQSSSARSFWLLAAHRWLKSTQNTPIFEDDYFLGPLYCQVRRCFPCQVSWQTKGHQQGGTCVCKLCWSWEETPKERLQQRGQGLQRQDYSNYFTFPCCMLETTTGASSLPRKELIESVQRQKGLQAHPIWT